jgi:hypothetical protein
MQNSQATTRTPPKEIRDRLRREVNYGCPICRSPFLTYHHFAPTWEPLHIHHEPGMIALCYRCHNFADGGNYTTQYLKDLKSNPPLTPPNGRLPWNAAKAFIMFGGNYFLTAEDKVFAFRVDGKEVFSLRPADSGYLSINASIHNAAGELMCQIEGNDILPNLAALGDLTCSAQGKEIVISSRANDTLLSLMYDRKEEGELLSVIESKWPKSFTAPLKIDKTNKVRGFIRSALDGDMLCPVIKIRANIYASAVPIRTLGKGISADFRRLGFDRATLTGLDAGAGGIRFVYSNTQKEMLYVGSE